MHKKQYNICTSAHTLSSDVRRVRGAGKGRVRTGLSETQGAGSLEAGQLELTNSVL